MGSVDLGIRAQLGEIERGFFDRAGAASSAPVTAPASPQLPQPETGDDPLLARYFARLERRHPWRWRGRVLESVGQTIESAGPLASVGECCEIRDQFGLPHLAEVIGFRGSNVLSMPVESTEGIRFGDSVAALGIHPEIEVGAGADGQGTQRSGRAHRGGRRPVLACRCRSMAACARRSTASRFATPLGTGIRVLDALLTVAGASASASSAAQASAKAP